MGLLGSVRVLLCLKLMLRLPQAGWCCALPQAETESNSKMLLLLTGRREKNTYYGLAAPPV